MSNMGRGKLRRVYLPEDLEFRPVTRADYRFLYSLLVERYESNRANIPGMATDDLPTFSEHVDYLESSPYHQMDVIVADGVDTGMVYLSRARVGGCFVLSSCTGRGIAMAATFAYFADCERPVTGNFNPRNHAAYRTVERLGFVRSESLPHRLTYELRGPMRDPFVRLRKLRQEGHLT
jgi:hypothetical protein